MSNPVEPPVEEPDDTVVPQRYSPPFILFTEYKASGEIVMSGAMASGYIEDMIDAGKLIIFPEAYPLPTDRVNTTTKQIEPKPVCPATLDGTTLRNLPIPSRVNVEQQWYDVTDGVLEMEFTSAGTYKVIVENPIFLTGTYEVTV